jgi:hypothetical protein
VNVERKLIIVAIVITACLAIGAGIIFSQKHSVNAELQKDSVDPAAASKSSGDASSAIAVGADDSTDKTKEPAKKNGYSEITWETLYQLDYKTGKMPDSLKKLNKTKVRIPGFIVPLSDDLRAIKEFLLVPNSQACIHVPPPPPNLIVYVTLDHAVPIEKVSNPSWLQGVLSIEKTDSEYGAASYKLQADKMEEYKL